MTEASAWAPPDASTKRLAPALIGARVRSAVTAEEVAVIAAAMEALWPKPVVVVAAPPTRQEAWRFSGRWWARPISARRPRPWY